MTSLVDQLTNTLHDVFVMYITAHSFHWNVVGPNFFQYHKLFGEIYEDVYESVDKLAEHIRSLGAKAPSTFKLDQNATSSTSKPSEMIAELTKLNKTVIDQLTKTLTMATKENKQGLANYLGERIEQHNKWNWFLESSQDKSVTESESGSKTLLQELLELTESDKKKKRSKVSKKSARSVYHRDYEKTKNQPYRKYDPKEYARKHHHGE